MMNASPLSAATAPVIPLHPLNAEFPILVRLAGKVTEVIVVRFKNTLAAIAVTGNVPSVSGIVNVAGTGLPVNPVTVALTPLFVNVKVNAILL
jgi:hypothetical protein